MPGLFGGHGNSIAPICPRSPEVVYARLEKVCSNMILTSLLTKIIHLDSVGFMSFPSPFFHLRIRALGFATMVMVNNKVPCRHAKLKDKYIYIYVYTYYIYIYGHPIETKSRVVTAVVTNLYKTFGIWFPWFSTVL